MKKSKSFCFDSFGKHPDTFQLNHLPKPMINHINNKAVMKSRLCGSCCLYFFYLIARMNCYDAILKMYFVLLNTPKLVFGNISKDFDHINDTPLFVQKPFLRSEYIESNMGEDINMKIDFKVRIYLSLLKIKMLSVKPMLIIFS